MLSCFYHRYVYDSLVTFLVVCTFFITFISSISAQSAPKTLAEKLGYPPDTKLLIVHADDLGVTHSVNAEIVEIGRAHV